MAKEARIFHEANSFKAASSHRIITEVYDFAEINTITDVGGGFGGLLKKSGFRLSQIIHTEENISVIEGIPE